MKQVLEGFVNRVYRIRIQGTIDQKMTDSVSNGLQKSWPYRPTALLVTINSPGGSIIQAKNIADQLKLYSNRYNIPVITFAEDQSLNSANIILTSGVRCYTSAFSMIGDVGYVWSSLWFSRFAKKYDLKLESLYSPENKVRFNRFEQLSPQNQKWAQNYVYNMEHQLKLTIINNRAQHFTKKGLSKETLEKSIFSQGIIDPQEAVSLGLIDGIRSLDQEIKERHSGVAVRQINKATRSWQEKLTSYSLEL